MLKKRRVTRWLRDLPVFYRVAIVGLVSIGFLVLLSPIVFIAGAGLFGVSVIALVIRISGHKSIREWGMVAVISLVLAFVCGTVSDALYGTHFLRAGYQLSPEEKTYVDQAVEIQRILLSRVSNQDALANSYRNTSPRDLFGPTDNLTVALTYSDKAEEVAVPRGCEDHHEAWSEGIQNSVRSITSSHEFLLTGSTEDAEGAKSFEKKANENFNEADRLLSQIRKKGCNR